ncbi:putative secreted protein [Rhodococcus sp. AW25M09]|uniref:endo alpha-1,4 polygalactosaminidase n=1 Tax=Rhodococcus sp. AW25M09 TaxID=1268303 RepID=UPI0002ABCBBF|nr:endo alpha-1,4 polygalactosaminidase [Rhodococcus sp. AW25M09]CCQ15335.1 putative secreted protein [Rhodococcus sp. AW25M09]
MRTAAVWACALAAAVALGGCSSDPASAERFDYQLGAAYETEGGVDTVVRDSTAKPLPGAYSICYVNGFQTQPGSAWNPELLLTDSDGEAVIDPEWPDENILDPSTAQKRAEIDTVLGPVIDACAAQGFSAVEIDNLDTWTRFPDLIDEDSVMALARLYADRAHASGMEIAQKNTPDGAGRIREDVGFDFAVAEECLAYDECGSYIEAYGSRVYDIEYTDNLPESFEELCTRQDRPSVTILRDRDLVAPTDPEYVYRQC